MKNTLGKSFIICLFAIFHITVSGQQNQLSSTSAKAKKIYLTAINEQFRIDNSVFVAEMRKAIKVDIRFVEPYWRIAELYGKNLKEAVKILELALANDAYYPDDTRLRLASLYKQLGRYDDAYATIEKLSDGFAQREQIVRQYEKLRELLQNPVPFEPHNLIYANTSRDEYFPSVTADDQVLSVTVSNIDDYYSNEDLYFSKKVGGNWAMFLPIAELNNADFNEGSQTISADGRYMFLVACNLPNGYGSCDIYYSINTNGRWSKPINAGAQLNTAYWESNPSLSPSGDELFFTSNRMPSVGGRDLWSCRVKILDDGKLQFWEPRNMGAIVNSTADDYAPYIHSDNQTLYFISTGHTNFGGSDIFITRKEDGVWGEPQNLGYPINNQDDCYGFTLTGAGNKGYLSLMNKDMPSRGLDIFEFVPHTEIRPNAMGYARGIVFDAESLKPLEATIETFGYNNRVPFARTISDKKTGEFTTFLPDTGQYGLNVRKSGYLFHSSKIINSDSTIKVYLHPIKAGKNIVLDNIFFAFNSYDLDPKSDNEILLLHAFMSNNPQVTIEIVGHTDNIGSQRANLTLSENRAKAVMNSLINKGISPSRLSYKGMGMSQPIATNDTDEGRERNRRVEFVVK